MKLTDLLKAPPIKGVSVSIHHRGAKAPRVRHCKDRAACERLISGICNEWAMTKPGRRATASGTEVYLHYSDGKVASAIFLDLDVEPVTASTT